jgi:hypothetical protein
LDELNEKRIADSARRYHGGINSLRERLGYELSTKPKGYWDDIENIKREVGEVIEKLGHFPTGTELRKLKRTDISNAISRYVGFPKIKSIMGYADPRITGDQDFQDFLIQDESVRNLATISLSMNGESYDVEQIMVGLYGERFKGQEHLHTLLQENRDFVFNLMKDGLTNLGAYIGDFSLGDKTIIPVLLGEALSRIPSDKITAPLEERIIRIQRSVYGPKFNENPSQTLEEIKTRVVGSDRKIGGLYQKLYDHYARTLELQEELKCPN